MTRLVSIPARAADLQRANVPDLRQLRLHARSVGTRAMADLGLVPHCDNWMVGHEPAFSRELARQGLVGMTLPIEFGGAGRSSLERYVVAEELLAMGAPVAAHWFADRQVGPALVRHGTPVQQQTYLPGIARGELFFAIGMSEADSGSDLAAVRTRATRIGEHWQLDGVKVWTSHAHVAHHMLVLARTDPVSDGDRRNGLSQFLVDLASPGVTVRPIESLNGGRHFNEVVLDGVRLPAQALLGTSGEGWSQVMQELALERSGPERFLSTAPLLLALVTRAADDDAGLGVLLAELRTLRGMSRAVAEELDRDVVPLVGAALVKDLGTHFEGKVAEVARACAPTEAEPISSRDYLRLLQEALLHGPERTLRGGASEVLRGLVAKGLLAP